MEDRSDEDYKPGRNRKRKVKNFNKKITRPQTNKNARSVNFSSARNNSIAVQYSFGNCWNKNSNNGACSSKASGSYHDRPSTSVSGLFKDPISNIQASKNQPAFNYEGKAQKNVTQECKRRVSPCYETSEFIMVPIYESVDQRLPGVHNTPIEIFEDASIIKRKPYEYKYLHPIINPYEGIKLEPIFSTDDNANFTRNIALYEIPPTIKEEPEDNYDQSSSLPSQRNPPMLKPDQLDNHEVDNLPSLSEKSTIAANDDEIMETEPLFRVEDSIHVVKGKDLGVITEPSLRANNEIPSPVINENANKAGKTNEFYSVSESNPEEKHIRNPPAKMGDSCIEKPSLGETVETGDIDTVSESNPLEKKVSSTPAKMGDCSNETDALSDDNAIASLKADLFKPSPVISKKTITKQIPSLRADSSKPSPVISETKKTGEIDTVSESNPMEKNVPRYPAKMGDSCNEKPILSHETVKTGEIDTVSESHPMVKNVQSVPAKMGDSSKEKPALSDNVIASLKADLLNPSPVISKKTITKQIPSLRADSSKFSPVISETKKTDEIDTVSESHPIVKNVQSVPAKIGDSSKEKPALSDDNAIASLKADLFKPSPVISKKTITKQIPSLRADSSKPSPVIRETKKTGKIDTVSESNPMEKNVPRYPAKMGDSCNEKPILSHETVKTGEIDTVSESHPMVKNVQSVPAKMGDSSKEKPALSDDNAIASLKADLLNPSPVISKKTITKQIPSLRADSSKPSPVISETKMTDEIDTVSESHPIVKNVQSVPAKVGDSSKEKPALSDDNAIASLKADLFKPSPVISKKTITKQIPSLRADSSKPSPVISETKKTGEIDTVSESIPMEKNVPRYPAKMGDSCNEKPILSHETVKTDEIDTVSESHPMVKNVQSVPAKMGDSSKEKPALSDDNAIASLKADLFNPSPVISKNTITKQIPSLRADSKPSPVISETKKTGEIDTVSESHPMVKNFQSVPAKMGDSSKEKPALSDDNAIASLKADLFNPSPVISKKTITKQIPSLRAAFSKPSPVIRQTTIIKLVPFLTADCSRSSPVISKKMNETVKTGEMDTVSESNHKEKNVPRYPAKMGDDCNEKPILSHETVKTGAIGAVSESNPMKTNVPRYPAKMGDGCNKKPILSHESAKTSKIDTVSVSNPMIDGNAIASLKADLFKPSPAISEKATTKQIPSLTAAFSRPPVIRQRTTIKQMPFLKADCSRPSPVISKKINETVKTGEMDTVSESNPFEKHIQSSTGKMGHSSNEADALSDDNARDSLKADLFKPSPVISRKKSETKKTGEMDIVSESNHMEKNVPKYPAKMGEGCNEKPILSHESVKTSKIDTVSVSNPMVDGNAIASLKADLFKPSPAISEKVITKQIHSLTAAFSRPSPVIRQRTSIKQMPFLKADCSRPSTVISKKVNETVKTGEMNTVSESNPFEKHIQSSTGKMGHSSNETDALSNDNARASLKADLFKTSPVISKKRSETKKTGEIGIVSESNHKEKNVLRYPAKMGDGCNEKLILSHETVKTGEINTVSESNPMEKNVPRYPAKMGDDCNEKPILSHETVKTGEIDTVSESNPMKKNFPRYPAKMGNGRNETSSLSYDNAIASLKADLFKPSPVKCKKAITKQILSLSADFSRPCPVISETTSIKQMPFLRADCTRPSSVMSKKINETVKTGEMDTVSESNLMENYILSPSAKLVDSTYSSLNKPCRAVKSTIVSNTGTSASQELKAGNTRTSQESGNMDISPVNINVANKCKSNSEKHLDRATNELNSDLKENNKTDLYLQCLKQEPISDDDENFENNSVKFLQAAADPIDDYTDNLEENSCSETVKIDELDTVSKSNPLEKHIQRPPAKMGDSTFSSKRKHRGAVINKKQDRRKKTKLFTDSFNSGTSSSREPNAETPSTSQEPASYDENHSDEEMDEVPKWKQWFEPYIKLEPVYEDKREFVNPKKSIEYFETTALIKTEPPEVSEPSVPIASDAKPTKKTRGRPRKRSKNFTTSRGQFKIKKHCRRVVISCSDVDAEKTEKEIIATIASYCDPLLVSDNSEETIGGANKYDDKIGGISLSHMKSCFVLLERLEYFEKDPDRECEPSERNYHEANPVQEDLNYSETCQFNGEETGLMLKKLDTNASRDPLLVSDNSEETIRGANKYNKIGAISLSHMKSCFVLLERLDYFEKDPDTEYEPSERNYLEANPVEEDLNNIETGFYNEDAPYKEIIDSTETSQVTYENSECDKEAMLFGENLDSTEDSQLTYEKTQCDDEDEPDLIEEHLYADKLEQTHSDELSLHLERLESSNIALLNKQKNILEHVSKLLKDPSGSSRSKIEKCYTDEVLGKEKDQNESTNVLKMGPKDCCSGKKDEKTSMQNTSIETIKLAQVRTTKRTSRRKSTFKTKLMEDPSGSNHLIIEKHDDGINTHEEHLESSDIALLNKQIKTRELMEDPSGSSRSKIEKCYADEGLVKEKDRNESNVLKKRPEECCSGKKDEKTSMQNTSIETIKRAQVRASKRASRRKSTFKTKLMENPSGSNHLIIEKPYDDGINNYEEHLESSDIAPLNKQIKIRGHELELMEDPSGSNHLIIEKPYDDGMNNYKEHLESSDIAKPIKEINTREHESEHMEGPSGSSPSKIEKCFTDDVLVKEKDQNESTNILKKGPEECCSGKKDEETSMQTTSIKAIKLAQVRTSKGTSRRKATSKTADSGETPCKKLKLGQLAIGTHHEVLRSDDIWCNAEIIDINRSGEKSEYYVHYEGFNRRMDEWVDEDRFNNSPTKKASLGERESNIPSNRKVTRSYKRRHEEINHVQGSSEEMDAATAAFEKEREKRTNVKFISKIVFDGYDINVWYFSPFPDEYGRKRKLHICAFCLKYMSSGGTYLIHVSICKRRRPPGREIYRKDTLSVFEVDGALQKVYCQNLCLLSKLFLDHKNLYFDVEPFNFYILTENDQDGAHFVGYFSKEKVSAEHNNLACILTLPPYQRRGFGRFLIAFSYELSKIEGVEGTPEKPLSDLGLRGYKSYWTYELLKILSVRPNSSVKDLCSQTRIMHNDVVTTLQSLNLVNFWRGEYIIPDNAKRVREHLNSDRCRKPILAVDPACINWSPPPKSHPSTKSKK